MAVRMFITSLFFLYVLGNGKEKIANSYLLIMRPHSEYLDRFVGLNKLIDQTVLDSASFIAIHSVCCNQEQACCIKHSQRKNQICQPHR